jgi:hypothetical protein
MALDRSGIRTTRPDDRVDPAPGQARSAGWIPVIHSIRETRCKTGESGPALQMGERPTAPGTPVVKSTCNQLAGARKTTHESHDSSLVR